MRGLISNIYLFTFYWFFSINPFFILTNAFGVTDIPFMYLFNIAVCISVLLLYIVECRFYKLDIYVVVMLLFFTYVVLYLIIGGERYGPLENGRNNTILNYFLPFIITSIGMFILGRRIDLAEIISSKHKYILLIPCVFILCNVTGFRVDYSKLKDPSLIGIYLVVGDVLCVSAMIFCLRQKITINSVFWFLFFSATLYLNNSRASFFIFVLSFFSIAIVSGFISSPKATVLFVILSLISAVYLWDDIVFLISLNERMAAVFTGNDHSSFERGILLEKGMYSISKNWLFGDMGGQLSDSGRLGGYIHNILEYWRQFGLLPFVIFITFIFFSIKVAIKELCNKHSNVDKVAFVGICASSIFFILFARSIPYSIIFFVIGYAINTHCKKEIAS